MPYVLSILLAGVCVFAQAADAQVRINTLTKVCQEAVVEAEQGAPNTRVHAVALNNLASLYYVQGHYGQAESLYQRALAMREHVLGPTHPQVAQTLNNLAVLYHVQGHYDQAESLYERALAIWEHALGPTHPEVASTLADLAVLYDTQGHYGQAESLYERALAIREQSLGTNHPDTKKSWDNLAAIRAKMP